MKSNQLLNGIRATGIVGILLGSLVEVLALLWIAFSAGVTFYAFVQLQLGSVVDVKHNVAWLIPTILMIAIKASLPAMVVAAMSCMRLIFSPAIWIAVGGQIISVSAILYAEEMKQK